MWIDVSEGLNAFAEKETGMMGEMVKVIVDRPLGSYHPEHKDLYYPVN